VSEILDFTETEEVKIPTEEKKDDKNGSAPTKEDEATDN
jgi:hypothetical protein